MLSFFIRHSRLKSLQQYYSLIQSSEERISFQEMFVLFKYYFQWRRSLKETNNPLQDGCPWMNFYAIDFLKKALNPSMLIFEYGGGGSTIFFLKRAKKVFTVEHNGAWFSMLQEKISKDKYTNWEGMLIAPEKNDTLLSLDFSIPDNYLSSAPEFHGYSFRNYASYIDKFPDNYFDIVCVDGRARPSCIKHGIPKLKQGGYLIVDNTEVAHYLARFQEEIIKHFTIISNKCGPLPYLKHPTKTTVLQKINPTTKTIT